MSSTRNDLKQILAFERAKRVRSTKSSMKRAEKINEKFVIKRGWLINVITAERGRRISEGWRAGVNFKSTEQFGKKWMAENGKESLRKDVFLFIYKMAKLESKERKYISFARKIMCALFKTESWIIYEYNREKKIFRQDES